MKNLIYYFVWTRHGKKMYRHEGDVKFSSHQSHVWINGEQYDWYIRFDTTTTPPTLMYWTTSLRLPQKFKAKLPPIFLDSLGNMRDMMDGKIIMGGTCSATTTLTDQPAPDTWRVTT